MTSITFIVQTVRIETIDVSSFGGFRDVTPGRTVVEFESTEGHPDSVSLDWTERGALPATGSRWTLTQVDG